jgi:hypothetical protein
MSTESYCLQMYLDQRPDVLPANAPFVRFGSGGDKDDEGDGGPLSLIREVKIGPNTTMRLFVPPKVHDVSRYFGQYQLKRTTLDF